MSLHAFLNADELRAATFLRHAEIHDTLGSTNDRAIELARDRSIETPAIVAARFQSAGRGRGDHKWWSTDGALTFSLILDTTNWSLHQRDWPQFSPVVAAAVCDALHPELRTGATSPPATPPPQLTIKLPNDVLLDGRKICGILIESPSNPAPRNNRLILGIGININNSWRFAPLDLASTGTSLCDITRQQHDLQTILTHFLNALEHRLQALQQP